MGWEVKRKMEVMGKREKKGKLEVKGKEGGERKDEEGGRCEG